MADFICTCVPEGQPSPHDNPRQCAANREATRIYMANITETNIRSARARGEALEREHDTHLRPVYGCPRCPMSINGPWYRDGPDSPWYIPWFYTIGQAHGGKPARPF